LFADRPYRSIAVADAVNYAITALLLVNIIFIALNCCTDWFHLVKLLN